MNLIDLNLMPAMPEIVLFALLIAVLLADLWVSDENCYLIHLMSLGTVIIVAITQLKSIQKTPVHKQQRRENPNSSKS